MAILVRDDGQVLMLRQAAGPFAQQWSMPFIGVADHETAEDALERLLREALHVTPGAYEFIDTLYLEGRAGERFIANAFSCVGWTGEPKFAQGVYDDAVWAPPGDPGALELVPQVREWLREAFQAATGDWGVDYDPAALSRALTTARGELLAAYEALPVALRHEPIEDGWSPLDVLTHAADVEAYYLLETWRAIDQPGHTWRAFNDAQWFDLLNLRPPEEEPAVRDRLELVRAETLEWLQDATAGLLAGYVNHPERGVVQVGDRIDNIARHDRDHVSQLRRMAQTAAMQETTLQENMLQETMLQETMDPATDPDPGRGS